MERQKFIIQLNTSSDPESENENNTSEEAGVSSDVKPEQAQEDDSIQASKISSDPDSENADSVDDATTQTDAEATAPPVGDPDHDESDKDRAAEVGRTEQARLMYPGGESGTGAGRRPERSTRPGRRDSSTATRSGGAPQPDPETITATTFPSLYICPAGLLTVLLGDDLAVEMALDRTIRLVNDRIQASAAVSSDGRLSCIHHELANVYQSGADVEAELFLDRRAKLGADRALFASRRSCFRLAANGIQKADPDFADLSHDMTISVLYSSSGYGPHLIDALLDRVRSAKYRRTRGAELLIWINGVRISQSVDGADVTVQSGSSVIRTSSSASSGSGRVVVETPLVRSVVDDKVQIRNASYQLEVTYGRLTVSDGRRECGFDHRQEVFIMPKTSASTSASTSTTAAATTHQQQQHHHHHQQQQHHHHHQQHHQQTVITNALSGAASGLSSTGCSPAAITPERYDADSYLLANPYVYYRYLNYHKLTCQSLVHS